MAGRQVTKKIINSPETCVDDNLRGAVAAYPMLRLHPKHRVITVRNKGDTGRVAVIGGGGSGHEPFASGFIGSGMLDAAVAGGVFASPPTGHVLYAIQHSYKYNSGGVLVILGNYTGDRLNFGKAIEKSKIAGVQVEGVIVGEDVASSKNKTGGRSMVGEVLFYKLCGAMSARGYDLGSIRDAAVEANKYMATLGVCLTACSLPGQPPLFTIAQDEMELGAGVHGEAGIAKIKMAPARQLVHMILDQIVSHLKLERGARVAAVVNNLGGTSFLEMNIITAETKDYLENASFIVERIYPGPLKTSLEMHGFQICVLHLNEEKGDLWLELLDDDTSAPGWTGRDISKKAGDGDENGDDCSLAATDVGKVSSGPRLTANEQSLLKGSLSTAADALVGSEALLNRLDSGCGDGDCGITLKAFATAIYSYVASANLEYPCNVLWDLSEFAETDMGGTSGGIYSLGLAAASQVMASASKCDSSSWLEAWEAAMQAITKYGGAEPGDRTMLDALHPAAEALKQNLNNDLKVTLMKVAEAADRGAQATANMTAKAGRASYVSGSYTTDEDAGARAVAVWLQAITRYIALNI